MKKAFKKLSTISLFVLIALLPSCDPGFYDTFKIKNELGRDIKATDLTVMILSPSKTAKLKSPLKMEDWELHNSHIQILTVISKNTLSLSSTTALHIQVRTLN